jgi:hypothetical protein
MDIYEIRKELKKMGSRKLFVLLLRQRESVCLLNSIYPCPFHLKYREHTFCVSELLHQGCQKEKSDNLTASEEDQVFSETRGNCEMNS